MEQLTELLRRHCSSWEKLGGVEKKWHKMREGKVSYKKEEEKMCYKKEEDKGSYKKEEGKVSYKREEGKVCYNMGEEFSSQLDCDIPGVQIRQETELGLARRRSGTRWRKRC